MLGGALLFERARLRKRWGHVSNIPGGPFEAKRNALHGTGGAQHPAQPIHISSAPLLETTGPWCLAGGAARAGGRAGGHTLKGQT